MDTMATEAVMLVPVTEEAGLTTIAMGVVYAIEQLGVTTAFFKPCSEHLADHQGHSQSTDIASALNIRTASAIERATAEDWIGHDKYDVLLEEVVARFKALEGQSQVIVIEGLTPGPQLPYANRLNLDIAKALGVDIVFVATPGVSGAADSRDFIDIARHYYQSSGRNQLFGCIINKFQASDDTPEEGAMGTSRQQLEEFFNSSRLKLFGLIPQREQLSSPRVSDLATHLNARVLNPGDMGTRRIRSLELWSGTLCSTEYIAGQVVVTPADRADLLAGAALATMNGIDLAAVVLTGGQSPEPRIVALCEEAMKKGLPVLGIDEDTWHTAQLLQGFNIRLPADDPERLRMAQEHVAQHLDTDWVKSLADGITGERHFSPPAFRHMLTVRARQADKRIVLPEGDEPRTIRAAALCAERKISRCVLLGDPASINKVAEQQGITIPDSVEIIDPRKARQDYIEPLVALREHKGVTALSAEDHLSDTIVLGTMMLQQGHVDGLVSGAVNTTANTIRPALQLIKTAPGSSLVSSVFFMLLPDQALVYGDCAINPDPTADQLADIAIQSADSAAAFDINPRVAMLSYSTGTSGTGEDVEKVRRATQLVMKKRPDILIDGPLQYDAAVMESVAKTKSPDSPVAGKATVLVFPDLNTGNTTYKAVQRSANLLSIGPMLQGLGKPVNDLSRGALVEDIVYTIALTAIQAAQTATNA